MDIKHELQDERERPQDEPREGQHDDEERRERREGRECIIIALNSALERDLEELFDRDRAA